MCRMVTKEEFNRYVKVQKSGVTNMWDVRRVEQLSGLDKATIMDIMKNYGKYKEEFSKLPMTKVEAIDKINSLLTG